MTPARRAAFEALVEAYGLAEFNYGMAEESGTIVGAKQEAVAARAILDRREKEGA